MRLSLNFNFFPTPSNSFFFSRPRSCVCERVCLCVCVSVLVVQCCSFFVLLFVFFYSWFFSFFLVLKNSFLFLYTRTHSSKKVFQVFRNDEQLCPLLYCLVFSFLARTRTHAAHCSHHEFQFLHSDSGLLQSIRPYNNYAIWTNPCYILLLNRLD